jgi:release factor glutamine methyltransferase
MKKKIGKNKEMLEQASRLLNETQKEKFPYYLNKKETFGFKIHVNKGVFSPKHFFGWKFFTPFLKVKGEDVLEIGCGHGISSLYMAKQAKKVVAVDLYPEAVQNTKENAEANKIKNIDCRVSNVYSGIYKNEKFDTIYWNLPWGFLPPNTKGLSKKDYLIQSGFDPGYKSIRKFIVQGRKYLKKNGRILAGISSDSSNLDLFKEIVKSGKMSLKLVASGKYLRKEKPEVYKKLGIDYYDFDDLLLYEIKK